MESPANLECADALVVFTFEEELDPGTCWSLALEGGADQGFWCLGGRREVGEGCGSQDGCKVDVLFYTLMGGLDGGALQG